MPKIAVPGGGRRPVQSHDAWGPVPLRIALHALAAAIVLVSALILAPRPAAAVASYDNGAIADRALAYVGQWGGNACADAKKPGDSGGQCRAFVNCIVWMVSNHTQNLGGADYFQPFLAAGGTEIRTVDELRKGDIVQIGQGVHTTIIVSRVSGNTFNVVDSNHNYDEKVMNYNRVITLDGSYSRAFRMGTVGATNTHPSVSVSNNAGQMAVQFTDFPLGTAYFFCHAGNPADWPTGGTVTARGAVNVNSSTQSWSSGLCAGNGNFWLGVQAPDGHDYYSNQVFLSTAPPGITVSNDDGQMVVRLSNFPLGTTYFFCHQGASELYPTGGNVPSHGSVVVSDPNQAWSSGWCSGNGNYWVGVQATDGRDYYSNTVVLAPRATGPSAPQAVRATAQPRSAAVSWTAPSSDGGSPILAYTVTASPSGRTCVTSTTSCTVTNLDNGEPTSFTVIATNGVGTGPASGASNAVIPADTPSAPPSVIAAPGNGSATITWQPAATNGSTILRYTVTASPGGETVTTSATSTSISGLTNGTAYRFSVSATNAVGTGPTTTSNVVTPTAPPQCAVPGASTLGFYRPSSLSTAAAPTAPAINRWSVHSATGCRYELQRQNATTGAWHTLYNGTASSAKSVERFGIIQASRVRSIDQAGTPSGWAMTTMTTLTAAQETAMKSSGRFSKIKSSSYWGGAALSSTIKGTNLTGAFRGRSLAVIGATGTNGSAVQVYVDGTRIAIVSEHDSKTHRRVVLAAWSGKPGAHKIKIVNAGGSRGHTTMVIDGLATVA